MADRSILEKNKAVLWARDIISRPDVCLIATQDEDGSVVIFGAEGEELMRANLLNGNAVPLDQFVAKLEGKELVVVRLPDSVLSLLRGRGVVVHDFLQYFKLYVNAPNAVIDSPQETLPAWARETVTKMAGSSLVLDQANTGDGKWTSAHFKPNPSMIEKLRSMMKS
jgi:hypothetical protein